MNDASAKRHARDLKKIKSISRKMLIKLEQKINQTDDNENLFIGKTSLVGALVTLTDLVLKIEAALYQVESNNKAIISSGPQALSEQEMLILKDYLHSVMVRV